MSTKTLEQTERELFQKLPAPFEAPAILLEETQRSWEFTPSSAKVSLNGEYLMTACETKEPDFSQAVIANIPCTVQTALLEAGEIPDPMYGKNDRYAREAAYKTWWFQKDFNYSEHFKRPRLCFDGVCSDAEFYLNGIFLGSHSGMFGRPEFDVSGILKDKNRLTVKILNAPADPKKYSDYADYDEGWKNGVVVNCVYGWHYACIPTRGIWDNVSILETPNCRLERPFIFTEDYQSGKIGICIYSPQKFSGILKIKVTPENFSGTTQYFESNFTASQPEYVHYSLTIRDHRLWWPNGYGEQPLYRFDLQIEPDGDDMIQHFSEVIGIRQIEMRPAPGTDCSKNYNWSCYVNGRYIFLKGTNWCTTDALLRFDEAGYRRFLALAKHQNLQLLRAWGGGLPERDCFYRICDELGLMVQQEWPTCWDSPKTQPYEQLEETVLVHTIRLRNHASLMRWAGGNELSAFDEPSIVRMAEIAYEKDGTRSFHRTSPYAGSLHNYDTYWLMEDMDHALNLRAPFIGEFGMASAPNLSSIAKYVPEHELSEKIDPTAKNAFNYHTPRFNEFLWPEEFNDMDHLLKHSSGFFPIETLEDFVLGTQLAQATAVRHTLEAQRADSPKAAGVCYYKLTDVYPACSWSTVDYYGVPKIPYYVFKNAFSPLHAMMYITSVRAADHYDIYLLDDCNAAKGLDCKIEIDLFDRDLKLLAHSCCQADRDSDDCKANADSGSYKVSELHLTEDCVSALRIIDIRLFVDGNLADSSFYILNYLDDNGFLKRLPKCKLQLSSKPGVAVIENISSTPAVGVFVECLAHDDTFTAGDNFLLLLPHEKREIPVSHTNGLSVRAINL